MPTPRHHPLRAPLAYLLLAGAALLAVAGAATAQQPAPAAPPAGGVGTITHLSGTLAVKKGGGETRFLGVNSAIGEGDTLATQQGTYARIKFADGGEVVMRPDTQFKVESYKYEEAKPDQDNMFVSLLKGGLRSVSGLIGKRNHDRVTFGTPTATVGIRGTHWGALFCENDCGDIKGADGKSPPNGLHLDVAQGAIVVRNSGGELVLNAGQFGYVQNPNAPPVSVPSSQGIQVTMPLSISRNVGGGGTVGRDRLDNECVL